MHKKICIYAKIVVLLHVFVCMSRRLLHIVYLLCAGLAMWSCASREAYTGKVESNAYAKGFVIEPQADYTVVKAFSPWQEGQYIYVFLKKCPWLLCHIARWNFSSLTRD